MAAIEFMDDSQHGAAEYNALKRAEIAAADLIRTYGLAGAMRALRTAIDNAGNGMLPDDASPAYWVALDDLSEASVAIEAWEKASAKRHDAARADAQQGDGD